MLEGVTAIKQIIFNTTNEIIKLFSNRNRFYIILSENNWPPPDDLLINSNLEKIDNIVERYNQFGHDSIIGDVNSLILSWHTEEKVNALLTYWGTRSWLKNRIKVLQDAIWAHNNGYYTLSIPTLIPQLEGLVAEHFRITGRLYAKDLKQYFQSLLHPAMIIKNRNENLNEFIVNTLLTQFEHGSETTSILSRNAIAHGGDIFYATKENSLRIILLLNATIKLFRLIALVNSKTVHVNGCPLVRNSQKERIFFSTIFEAYRDGYKMCKKCGTGKINNYFY